MLRTLIAVIASLLLASSLKAADEYKRKAPQLPPELQKAKDEYIASTAKAKQVLLDAIAAEQKKVKTKPGLDVEEKVRLTDELKLDAQEFSEQYKRPKSASMKNANKAYEAKVAVATAKCDKIFEQEAKKAGKMDLAAAKEVLEARDHLFERARMTAIQQRVHDLLTNSVWVLNGSHYEFTPDGRMMADNPKVTGGFLIDHRLGEVTLHVIGENAATGTLVIFFDKMNGKFSRNGVEMTAMKENEP